MKQYDFVTVGNYTKDTIVSVAGTRYDIAMKAHKADVTTEAKLVLYQRQG